MSHPMQELWELWQVEEGKASEMAEGEKLDFTTQKAFTLMQSTKCFTLWNL